MPVDGEPIVGPVVEVPGLYLAVLHSAVTLAPAVGRLLARELVDGPVEPVLAAAVSTASKRADRGASVGDSMSKGVDVAGGRRDDERLIVGADAVGTATRPVRVQRTQQDLVEPVDNVADGVLVRGDQASDRG